MTTRDKIIDAIRAKAQDLGRLVRTTSYGGYVADEDYSFLKNQQEQLLAWLRQHHGEGG